MALRPVESVEDIRLNIRLALFDFLSPFSSLAEPKDSGVGGGEMALGRSLLEDIETRLLIEPGRLLEEIACVEGGRDGDFRDGEVIDGSRLIDRRRSAIEERRSLNRSLTIVSEDLLSFVPDLDEFESRLSRIVSFLIPLRGAATAFW